MELRIYEGAPPALVAIADDMDSVRIKRGYRKPGEIVIKAPLRSGASLYAVGQTVLPMGFGEAFIIESVEIKHSNKTAKTTNEDKVTVRGRTHAALLDTRVITQSKYYAGTVSLIAQQMITDITTQTGRGLPGITLGFDTDLGVVTMYQPDQGSLLTAVERVLTLGGLGLRSVYQPETGEAVLQLYEGLERSQAASPPLVVFDTDLDSISDTSVKRKSRGTANAAFVLGENTSQGVPKQETVELEGSDGPDRREILLRFSQTSKTDYGTQLTDTQYRGAMRAYASSYLAKMNGGAYITGGVSSKSSPYKEGADYAVGDIALIRPKGVASTIRARIDAIETIWAKDAEQISRLVFAPAQT
jgi:hypothetical protein